MYIYIYVYIYIDIHLIHKGEPCLGPYAQTPLSMGRPPPHETLDPPSLALWPFKGSVLNVYTIKQSRRFFGAMLCNKRICMQQLRASGAVH